MKKLALDVESLRIESFSISPAESTREGTVHSLSGNAECLDDTKSEFWSCVCTDSGMYTCDC